MMARPIDIETIQQPALLIDVGRSQIVAANTTGRNLWGLHTTETLPVALSSDMPALTALARPARDGNRQDLVFWTRLGAQRLPCRLTTMPDASAVLVEFDEPHSQSSRATNVDATVEHADNTPLLNAKNGKAGIDARAMAHELRTPLSAIVALAEMIENEQFGPIGDKRYVAYAKDIRDSAKLTLGIVANALEDGSNGSDGALVDFSEFNPIDLIEQCVRTVRPASEAAGVTLRLDLDPTAPHIIASPSSLKQILLNFLGNSIKFTPQGGTIEISASQSSDGSLSITVTDNGVGMNRNDARILAPDHTLSAQDSAPQKSRAERGIGFSLIRRLAAAMDAEFKIESERGTGTRVTLRFPATKTLPVASASLSPRRTL